MKVAFPCAHRPCRRTTTDPSGRCHDHRGSGSTRTGKVLSSPAAAVAPTAAPGALTLIDLESWIGVEFETTHSGFELTATRLPLPPGITRYDLDEFGNPASGRYAEEIVYTDGVSEIRMTSNGSQISAKHLRNGKYFRSDDGPTEQTFTDLGKHAEDRWWTGTGDKAKLHRLNGPAYVAYYADGEIYEQGYYRKGEATRLEGPQYVQYGRNGNVTMETYGYRGLSHNTAEGFYAGIANLAGSKIREYFDGTPFEVVPLNREWEALNAFAAGVRTPEGVLEVLGGAPAEWVRSYEEGRA